MKAMQDSGALDFYSEMAYVTHRSGGKDDPRVLDTGSWMKNPYRSRRIHVTDPDVPGELQRFWCTPPNPRGKKLLAQSHPRGDKWFAIPGVPC